MAKKSDNGNEELSVKDSLALILKNQNIISERVDEIEDKINENADVKNALLQLVNLYYNTDDTHILELSYISPLAAAPIAESLALDAMTSPDVRNGKVSLNTLVIMKWLRSLRSVRGRHLGLGAAAMQDQVNTETKEEPMSEIEAGRE